MWAFLWIGSVPFCSLTFCNIPHQMAIMIREFLCKRGVRIFRWGSITFKRPNNQAVILKRSAGNFHQSYGPFKMLPICMKKAFGAHQEMRSNGFFNKREITDICSISWNSTFLEFTFKIWIKISAKGHFLWWRIHKHASRTGFMYTYTGPRSLVFHISFNYQKIF